MQIVLRPGGAAALAAGAGVLSFAAFAAARRDAPAAAPPQAPVTLVEAEVAPRGEVKADPAASGGKYVRVTGDYQPLIVARVPKGGDGDAFTVWARLRGTAAQLKGTPGGKQKEYEWSWDRSEEFRWVRLGRHTRAELGDEVLLIRAPGKGEADDDGIDALAFAADDAYDPNRAAKPDGTAFLASDFKDKAVKPAAPSPAGPVAVTVDWSAVEGTTTRAQYGMNLYAGFHPENVKNPAYHANLEYMGPGLLRLHNGGKLNDSAKSWEGLIDSEKRTWDRKKIAATLASLQLAGKPQLLFNVPSWPAWMDADHDGFLDRDQYDAYAALLADLVRIVNVENRAGVRYWEVTNELDSHYFTPFYDKGGWGALKDPAKPDRWDEVAVLYNKAAVAMKRVDPTIRIGGPAAARPDLSMMHERFVKATLPNLDFFSMHAYACGDAATPDADVYDRADLMGKYTASTVAMLKKLSPDRPIPVMLGEYNVSWTWETRDPRMVNNKGAVFDALVLVREVEAGAFSTQAWNEKDGIYGKTDPQDKRRPGAEVFHLFNTYLVGRRAKAESADEKAVVAYAVADPTTKHRSLLLVNRSGSERSVKATFAGRTLAAKPYLCSQVTADGLKAIKSDPLPGGNAGSWTLPPDSVTVLTFAD
jgi:xylan 1,4-beta-xylosidase